MTSIDSFCGSESSRAIMRRLVQTLQPNSKWLLQHLGRNTTYGLRYNESGCKESNKHCTNQSLIPVGVTIAGFRKRNKKNPPTMELTCSTDTLGYFSWKRTTSITYYYYIITNILTYYYINLLLAGTGRGMATLSYVKPYKHKTI